MLARYRHLCWLFNILVSLDQLLNTVTYIVPMPQGTRLGSGDPDETFSHWWAHLAGQGVGWAQALCTILDWIHPGHSPNALVADAEGFNTPDKMAERARKGLPVVVSGLR